jgi:hypothetical protein
MKNKRVNIVTRKLQAVLVFLVTAPRGIRPGRAGKRAGAAENERQRIKTAGYSGMPPPNTR